MIVSTQFDRWHSAAGDVASERLDILGLDSQGRPVVVELKRGADKKVHLQALTYAALVARFGAHELGAAHAAHLTRGGVPTSAEEGFHILRDHVDSEWDAKMLSRPRVVLVAEHFPPQVITTVSWLQDVSGGLLAVECIEYSLFADQHRSLSVGFSKIWPVADLDDRLLGPKIAEERDARQDIAERSRGPRVAAVAVRNELIPNGARLTLDISKTVSRDVVDAVERWLDSNPDTGYATWGTDPARPLSWPGDTTATFSLTRLAKIIIARATDAPEPASIPGGDVWVYDGLTVSRIAARFTNGVEEP
ncbi:DNA-binding protein [Rhodococcus sp. MEB041]|uniref:DNA-binding protein n=1 Tax=Rhodococcus sp. MEB041 TaxID=3040323 RepID=UPI00254D53D6|nr:DNA-binding protein [Rhodococcus sp. MEB041]